MSQFAAIRFPRMKAMFLTGTPLAFWKAAVLPPLFRYVPLKRVVRAARRGFHRFGPRQA